MEPGRKLDALVAEKVMGWTLNRFWPVCDLRIDQSKQCEQWFNEEAQYSDLPNYSTNLKAAWEILEIISCHSLEVYWEEYFGWRCEISLWDTVIGDMKVTKERGDTAPHAICKAALRLYGVDLND